MASILTGFGFTKEQGLAAVQDSRAISVTAGAGSGKTGTLVGRYLHLLEEGAPLRSLIAITFTDKAAREMRTRIRQVIEKWLASPPENAEAAQNELWENAFSSLEAAHIGTIHSLCAEILHMHPAEAGIDPNFEVLEEGLAAALQARALDLALTWAAGDPQASALFSLLKENQLRKALALLLNRKLDFSSIPQHPAPLEAWSRTLAGWIHDHFGASGWSEPLETLAALQAINPDDTLEQARQEVLSWWGAACQEAAVSDWQALFTSLNRLRAATALKGSQGNWDGASLEAARQAMRDLREYYDAEFAPLAGKGKEPSTRWTLDERVAGYLPLISRLLARAKQEYQRLKDERRALDFDDLEGRTAELLSQRPDVCQYWQDGLRALLVDEFQDTNERQRQIVYALTGFEASPDEKASGPAADLFVVGDAKQSIYKFRGADVTVFRRVQNDITAAGGLPVDLNLTFRAHDSLVESLNALLAPILGESQDSQRSFQVPFSALKASRQDPNRVEIGHPFVEFHLGLGENADSGRTTAAASLANRLKQLHALEKFAWGDMALLFRASTAFGVYEEALEQANIPFVTVAGRGFYDRPEIRDLLNALTAIADPADDLALAGLLRSPAIGLSDAQIYCLRFPGSSAAPWPLWNSLISPHANGDLAQARAAEMIAELHALSGRAPAAEVLKRFLDLSGYRAILGALPEGRRLLRNVDKLLIDAHRSRLVGLGEFLEYVQTLRDTGLREGEAPVEAGGAVQLMSVHKAKGLEFPLVVIADAAYEHRGGAQSILLDPDLGLLLDARDLDGASPVIWRLASLAETEKDEAEDRRLLYVAATRAREKLLISGHTKILSSGQLSLRGWLKRLGQVIGLDSLQPQNEVTGPQILELASPFDAGGLVCNLYPPTDGPPAPAMQPGERPAQPDQTLSPPDLLAPLQPSEPAAQDGKVRQRESDPPQRVWRIIPRTQHPSGPAWVVGKLVHEALHRWRFPDPAVGQTSFDEFLRPFALETGLTDPAEIRATLGETRRLLERFRLHPLYAKIEAAERHHEVPYVLPDDVGIIDLIYCTPEGWMIADFKTDALRSEAEARKAIHEKGYDQQLNRYAEAVASQLGQRPHTQLVFLRVANQVCVFD